MTTVRCVFISASASAHANVNGYSHSAILCYYESRCTLIFDNRLLRVYVGVSYKFRSNHISGLFLWRNRQPVIYNGPNSASGTADVVASVSY